MNKEFGTYGEKKNVYRTLMGRPDGKSLFGRSRPRWANITMNIK